MCVQQLRKYDYVLQCATVASNLNQNFIYWMELFIELMLESLVNAIIYCIGLK